MGTRHLIGVIMDGEWRVAQYGQWDGSPSGQGVEILKFLRELTATQYLRFREQLKRTYFGTAEEIDEAYAPYSQDGMMTLDQAEAFKRSRHGHNSRDTGADILQVVLDFEEPVGLEPAPARPGLMLIDSRDFARDSLFCEWAYIIDLDTNTLEVYRGFNKQPVPAGERFSNVEPQVYKGRVEYYPIRLLKTYSLLDLPKTAVFEKELDELVAVEDE